MTPFGFSLSAGNYAANRMMQHGEFEPEETEIIRRSLGFADVFVDVGANIGFYTCLARLSGKTVVAIEPQPRNLACLFANLINNNWTDTEVYPMGLSDHPGLVPLYGASGPSASLLRGWAGYSHRYRQTIPVTTLDTLLGNRFRDQKLMIKIDVEGAEYQVLRGSNLVMAMSPRPVWLIEICLSEYHPEGINPNFGATFQLFWQHGYEAHTANRANRLVRPDDVDTWIHARRSDSGTINYLFS